MNWEAISAIGEITGALAVFVTLIYLAIQIRQNTKAIQAAANQGTTNRETNALVQLINHPDILILITKPDLADEEITKLYAFLSLTIRNHEHYWGQYQLGAIDLSSLERFEASLKALLSFERTQNWWKNQTAIQNSEFRKRVDLLISELPARDSIVTDILRQLFGKNADHGSE